MERGWRREQLSRAAAPEASTAPVRVQEGCEGALRELLPTSRFCKTTPKALLSQLLSACPSVGHDASLSWISDKTRGSVGDD